MGPGFVADGVTLAIAEMLRGGTTCCNENYFFPDVQAATYKRHGFRARVGLPVIDFPTAWAGSDDESFERAGEVHDQWRGDALVGTAFAPHAPYTVNDANFERVRMLADQLDGPVHLHLHETAQEVRQSLEKHGQRPIARLDRLGLVNDRLIAVHMTQLTEAEIHARLLEALGELSESHYRVLRRAARFGLPALRRSMGHSHVFRRTIKARLTHPVKIRPGRTEFIRVVLERNESSRLPGSYVASSTGTQSSGALLSMALADGLAAGLRGRGRGGSLGVDAGRLLAAFRRRRGVVCYGFRS